MIPGIAKFSITTDDSGDYTDTLPERIQFAFLYAVEWTNTDFGAGVDAALSLTSTPSGSDKPLLTLTDADVTKWYFPREETHDLTGTANGGLDYQVLAGKLKLVVSSGGDTKTGNAIVYYVR